MVSPSSVLRWRSPIELRLELLPDRFDGGIHRDRVVHFFGAHRAPLQRRSIYEMAFYYEE